MAAVLEEIYIETLIKKALGSYLGVAVGDALGATVEFMSPVKIRKQFGVHKSICGGGWLGLDAGQVTDDTTMSLVLGESILQNGRVDPGAVAKSFSDWLNSNPIDVGDTIKRGIIHYRYSGTPSMRESAKHAGNGACMRTAPLALATFGISDKSTIRNASKDQAHITHNNILSDAATECVIEMIHAGLSGEDKLAMRNGPVDGLVKRHPEFSYDESPREMPTGYIVETMQAVFQSFFSTDNFENNLIDVVNRGGDADTTGAISGMIAGSYYGLDAIPERWLTALDSTVLKACEHQAKALLKLEYGSGVK